ncbi:hypothetical protein F5890DRAFT_1495706 [Lentinula detonsa]|uniref:Uncharacterized protein n=1 Tax=Lentinula detonsa TaxID=2804962 RepID=A0AA38Q6Z3_9AGAR|nr:hypothetical protein F5890DRAFT_1495706 [Lentinula detonsa]
MMLVCSSILIYFFFARQEEPFDTSPSLTQPSTPYSQDVFSHNCPCLSGFRPDWCGERIPCAGKLYSIREP